MAMQYFIAAPTSGSNSEAVKQLHAALSAVNQAEEAFGLQLITRHFGKGIASAATWRILMARIQPPPDEYKALTSQGAEVPANCLPIFNSGSRFQKDGTVKKSANPEGDLSNCAWSVILARQKSCFAPDRLRFTPDNAPVTCGLNPSPADFQVIENEFLFLNSP